MLRLGLARGRVELLQFFRSREAMIFTIALPVLMLGLFGAMLHYDVDGVSFTTYFTPSMLAAGIFAASFQNVAIAIPMDREKGVHRRLSVTPLSPMSYVIGKIVLAVVVSTLSMLVFIAVATVAYGVRLPFSPGTWMTVLWIGALGVVTCVLLGVACAAIPRSARAAPAVITPLALILQVISGVFVPSEELPSWLAALGELFPLAWILEGLQTALLPDSTHVRSHLLVTTLVLMLWLAIGLAVCQKMLRWRSATR